MAAYRAGIKTVVFPSDNQKDLVEIPESIRSKITFVAVSAIDEVFQHAFAGVAERIAQLEAKRKAREAQRASGPKAKRRKAARRGPASARRNRPPRAAGATQGDKPARGKSGRNGRPAKHPTHRSR